MSNDDQTIHDALAAFGPKASKLVELTLKDADKFMAEIEQAFYDGDPDLLGIAAHSLKSILKQVGARSAADIAFEIETGGKAGDLKVCANRLPDLREKYDATRQTLTAIAA
jgi:HPt (histidine-containing phosphotransfer) domain-containing protein